MSYMECEFCLKKFVRESYYKKHECEEMRRHGVLRTTHGISAFNDYKTWFEIKGFTPYGKDQFVDSRHFTSFVNFSKFATKKALPHKRRFMECMVKLEIQPKDWCNKIVYEYYIKQFEALLTPEEQAAVSVDTIFELSRIFECEANEIFLHIHPKSLLMVVQAKKLSPWFLMFSPKFHGFVANVMSREEQIMLEIHINPDAWKKVFDRNPKKVEKMKKYVIALGL